MLMDRTVIGSLKARRHAFESICKTFYFAQPKMARFRLEWSSGTSCILPHRRPKNAHVNVKTQVSGEFAPLIYFKRTLQKPPHTHTYASNTLQHCGSRGG